jgi:hypothetical protein
MNRNPPVTAETIPKCDGYPPDERSRHAQVECRRTAFRRGRRRTARGQSSRSVFQDCQESPSARSSSPLCPANPNPRRRRARAQCDPARSRQVAREIGYRGEIGARPRVDRARPILKIGSLKVLRHLLTPSRKGDARFRVRDAGNAYPDEKPTRILTPCSGGQEGRPDSSRHDRGSRPTRLPLGERGHGFSRSKPRSRSRSCAGRTDSATPRSTFYKWRAMFSAMQVPEARRLRDLEGRTASSSAC